MNIRIFLWRPLAVLWAANIFTLSTSGFRSSRTRHALARLFALLNISVPPDFFYAANLALRKSAHLLEYAIFSGLLYLSFRDPSQPRWQQSRAAWALVVAVTFSLTDEFHQTLVVGRSASLMDCFIDSTGALLALWVIYVTSTRPRFAASALTIYR